MKLVWGRRRQQNKTAHILKLCIYLSVRTYSASRAGASSYRVLGRGESRGAGLRGARRARARRGPRRRRRAARAPAPAPRRRAARAGARRRQRPPPRRVPVHRQRAADACTRERYRRDPFTSTSGRLVHEFLYATL